MTTDTGIGQATRRQRFMLWTLTKDASWYDMDISIRDASDQIAALMRKKQDSKVDQLVEFQQLWDEALAAGQTAMEATLPTPMVVVQHSNMMDDTSPVEKQWLVPDGVCGFAWISIKPATSPFARWLKDKGYAKHDAYYGGITYWVHQGNQSMELKENFAHAMAKVLTQHVIHASAMSRMD